ncbi:CsbD family protein, partial [Salmonella sp. NW985]|uniref:CsbD family protein n=2 Tax=unclassified Salmonella TaxID=2614656 RepID=UPI003EC6C0B4
RKPYHPKQYQATIYSQLCRQQLLLHLQIQFNTMSEPNKAHGTKDQVTGQIQETVGGIIGNDRMRAEGAATREGGKAEVNAAKAENRAEATGTDIKGHAKDAFGALTGDNKMQAEGKADKTKADAQHNANRF